jgi:hypothetical protein
LFAVAGIAALGVGVKSWLKSQCDRTALIATFACPLMCQQDPVPVEQEPLHHVVLKNDAVMVIHLTLPPGETTRMAVEAKEGSILGVSPEGKASLLFSVEGAPSPIDQVAHVLFEKEVREHMPGIVAPGAVVSRLGSSDTGSVGRTMVSVTLRSIVTAFRVVSLR